MSGGLAEWFQRVRDNEKENYWPGPRPLDYNDRDEQLVGRTQDVRDIVRILGDTQLLVISGATGDGKSSLLDRGVRPELARLGNVILLCNDWSGTGHDVEDGEDFLQAKLGKQLKQLAPMVSSERDFVSSLDTIYGDRAIIILDQFEELIRHEPLLFTRVCTWIESVVATSQVRIIISLREEYAARLRSLDVSPYARRDFVVDPISDADTIRKLLVGGQRADGQETIDKDAVVRLIDLWITAEGGSRATGIGLLHLQALLYVLWRRRPLGDGIVNVAELKLVEDEILGANVYEDTRDRAVGLFQRSLSAVVGLRLELCKDEYRGAEIDGEPTLATGAARLIRRMAGFLSSGGYKVDQDRWHLAELVLDGELTTLGYRDKDERAFAAAMFSDVSKVVDQHGDRSTSQAKTESEQPSDGAHELAPVDYLSAPRAELVSDPAALERSGTRDPWDTDRDEVTGGMMMGATPAETLIEVYRQYFFALEWLQASYLVRRTYRSVSHRQIDETTVSLIHDGFGRGLVDWASRDEERPAEHFGLLIAAVGETIRWVAPIDGTADTSYRLAVNLRWKSCLVTATFRHMTFVNCDFRNSTFVGCEFEGVTFVNCLLDGVSFSDCMFRGEVPRLPDLTDEEKDELKSSKFDLLSFSLPLPSGTEHVIRSLVRYREIRDLPATATLYSLTSGLPVTPSRGEAGYDVPAVEGGLVMYGGRLSSLVFGRCTFPDGGRVALRDLTGTSLEFAEQAVGNIELRNVALRGLTISAPLDYIRTPGDGVELSAYFSLLQNVWISARVPGSAVLEDSRVWQLANTSTDFAVTSPNSPPIRGHLELDDEDMNGLAETALKVDYRSIPAKRELTLRRENAKNT